MITKLTDAVVLEHAESAAGVIVGHHIDGVEDVGQLIASEASEVGVISISLVAIHFQVLALDVKACPPLLLAADRGIHERHGYGWKQAP